MSGGGRRFVDAHHHFQDLTHHVYPWLTDRDAAPKLEGDLAAIRRDYLPADYRADLDGVDLVASVHVQNGWNPSDCVGETRWLARLAETEGAPDAIVAYADLAAADVEATLEAHAACARVRGVREILNWHEEPRFRVAARADLMRDDDWRRGFARLRRHGFSFDLQIYWPQMSDALRLAADFPDTLFLLNHFGMPIDRTADGVAQWLAAMTRLATAPNVWVKLSGLGLGHPAWTVEDTLPLLRLTLDRFGLGRCMLGTNLPVDRLFAPPRQTFAAFVALTRGMSDDERDALYFRNAMTAYRL
ncbi:MAG: amidohydrolase family protein [Pseudomonadota bacterium]|nr:amidohydrolase family protein [Pseudomonadota bacterium]